VKEQGAGNIGPPRTGGRGLPWRDCSPAEGCGAAAPLARNAVFDQLLRCQINVWPAGAAAHQPKAEEQPRRSPATRCSTSKHHRQSGGPSSLPWPPRRDLGAAYFGLRSGALLGKTASHQQRQRPLIGWPTQPVIILLDADAASEAQQLYAQLQPFFRGRLVQVQLPAGQDPGSCPRAELCQLVQTSATTQGVLLPTSVPRLATQNPVPG